MSLALAVLGFARWGNALPGLLPIEDNEPTTIRVFADHTSMIAGFSGNDSLFTQRYGVDGAILGVTTIPVPFREGILAIGMNQELYAAATQADGSFTVRRFAPGSAKLEWLAPYTSGDPGDPGRVTRLEKGPRRFSPRPSFS